jgi:hypothetical protein
MGTGRAVIVRDRYFQHEGRMLLARDIQIQSQGDEKAKDGDLRSTVKMKDMMGNYSFLLGQEWTRIRSQPILNQ